MIAISVYCRTISSQYKHLGLSSQKIVLESVFAVMITNRDRNHYDMACVYIFRSGDENIFKIGHTRNDPNARRKQLSTGNPRKLTLFETIQTQPKQHTFCEAFLHKQLRSKRIINGDAREFFSVNPTELIQIIQDARKFLEDFGPKQKEVARLAKQKSVDKIIVPGQEEKKIYRRLVVIREEQDRLELERMELENKLKLTIGIASELEGIATWKSSSRMNFNIAKFRIDEPEMHKAYLSAMDIRTFILR